MYITRCVLFSSFDISSIFRFQAALFQGCCPSLKLQFPPRWKQKFGALRNERETRETTGAQRNPCSPENVLSQTDSLHVWTEPFFFFFFFSFFCSPFRNKFADSRKTNEDETRARYFAIFCNGALLNTWHSAKASDDRKHFIFMNRRESTLF